MLCTRERALKLATFGNNDGTISSPGLVYLQPKFRGRLKGRGFGGTLLSTGSDAGKQRTVKEKLGHRNLRVLSRVFVFQHIKNELRVSYLRRDRFAHRGLLTMMQKETERSCLPCVFRDCKINEFAHESSGKDDNTFSASDW